jgi:hypothetical protein
VTLLFCGENSVVVVVVVVVIIVGGGATGDHLNDYQFLKSSVQSR